MYTVTSFKDLITQIEISKIRMESILEQRELLLKLMYTNAPTDLQAMNYTDMPKGSGKNAMSLDRIVDGISRLDNMIIIEDRILSGMEEAEQKISNKLKNFEGISYKVAYLKDIKGKTSQEIADELGYSIGYIQNISAKLHKKKKV